MSAYVKISLFLLLSAGGQLALKRGVSTMASLAAPGLSWWLQALTNGWVIIGLGAWGGATLLWLAILAQLPLGAAYPVTSLNYLLIPAAAAVFLGEQIRGVQILGFVAIASGVALVLWAGRGQ